jgi:transcriptional regulator GlxA family with amidase domain
LIPREPGGTGSAPDPCGRSTPARRRGEPFIAAASPDRSALPAANTLSAAQPPAPVWQKRVRAASGTRHLVAMLILPGTPIVELAVPTEVFGPHRLEPTEPRYDLRMCGLREGRTRVAPAFTVETPHGLDGLAGAGTVIVAADAPDAPSDLPQALRGAHAHGARIAAIGSGTFLLAASGLLTRRHATTHWSQVEKLRRYPDVRVDPSALYTHDGTIFTCAGGAATLDLCLELVRLDAGTAAANTVARRVLAPLHRTGEQAQLVQTTVSEDRDFATMLKWALARLDQPLTLADLSRAANMSPRTLARRFHASLATTPLQWLLTQRIRLAQQLLETTNEPVHSIAERTGLGSLGNLRKQFGRATGMAPQTYRRLIRHQRHDVHRPGRLDPDSTARAFATPA